ncbi:protein of unknown function [Algoriphagus locisalis]|uniref:DUF4221 domain-containing protein n=1 Tax=Algoriphagus locisalis TaxID=305507 RepID=A0A1I7ANH6_9BACT|nr:DUF4221 family protein [Algoriphagus locisalis]SFT76531.1 protein of unknown function [Algoriphagus locisalis]
MKKLLTISALALLSACGEKPKSEEVAVVEEPKNILENMTYTVDTVLVDTGDDFINFAWPFISSPSPNGNYFYVLDLKNEKLQKIDLDLMKLTDTFTIYKDGPNSPGSILGVTALHDDQFFFSQLHRLSVINKEGEKTRSWILDGDKIVEGFSADGGSVSNRIILDKDFSRLYSLPLNYETRDTYFAVLDSAGEKIMLEELTEFQKANKFRIQGDSEGKGEFLHLQQFNDLVLISCSVGNGTYIYNPSLDSLFYREFPHEIVPLEKTGEVKNKVGGRAEFEEELKKLNHQINYWSFLWDEKSQRYFRYASRAIGFDEEGWAKEFEIFFMAYSKDMELIGETRFGEFSTIPFGLFFKDGKLYSYVNVEDELGFAVFTFNF